MGPGSLLGLLGVTVQPVTKGWCHVKSSGSQRAGTVLLGLLWKQLRSKRSSPDHLGQEAPRRPHLRCCPTTVPLWALCPLELPAQQGWAWSVQGRERCGHFGRMVTSLDVWRLGFSAPCDLEQVTLCLIFLSWAAGVIAPPCHVRIHTVKSEVFRYQGNGPGGNHRWS